MNAISASGGGTDRLAKLADDLDDVVDADAVGERADGRAMPGRRVMT